MKYRWHFSNLPYFHQEVPHIGFQNAHHNPKRKAESSIFLCPNVLVPQIVKIMHSASAFWVSFLIWNKNMMDFPSQNIGFEKKLNFIKNMMGFPPPKSEFGEKKTNNISDFPPPRNNKYFCEQMFYKKKHVRFPPAQKHQIFEFWGKMKKNKKIFPISPRPKIKKIFVIKFYHWK